MVSVCKKENQSYHQSVNSKKMKIVLIVIGSLLLVGVVYLIVKKKKESAAAEAATSSSTITKVNPVLAVASATPVDTTVYDSTSGVVTSKPKPIVVVATVLSNTGCKAKCDAAHPFNKGKRDDCKAKC